MVRVLDAVVLIPGVCLQWDVESSVTPTSHREPRSCESVTTLLVLCMFSQSSAGLNTSFAGGDLRLPELPEYFDSRSGSGLYFAVVGMSLPSFAVTIALSQEELT